MVFVSNANEILLKEQREILLRQLHFVEGQNPLDRSFVAWLLPTEDLAFDLKSAAQSSAKNTGAERTYQDVAILSFAADVGLLNPRELESLEEGLRWLSARPLSVNRTTPGICVDAVAAFGVSLGAKRFMDTAAGAQARNWMAGFIHSSYEMRDIEGWHKCLFAASQHAMNISPELPVPDDSTLADVRVALSARNMMQALEGAAREEDEQRALLILKGSNGDEQTITRMAFSIAAFNAIRSSPLHMTTRAIDIQQSKKPSGVPEMIKILFLAASPTNEVQLRLSEEARQVEETLREANFRDSFTIEKQLAVRVTDLQKHLMRYQPTIVHFSGHGSSSRDIILEDINGKSHPVSARALGDLFSVLKDNIRCVVLNACFSETQAEAIAQHIDIVIGMSDEIDDRSAISFASSFYQALAYGRNVEEAYKLGCIQIDMENLNDQDIPKLIANRIDAKTFRFIR